MPAPLPPNEPDRLAKLADYRILDTLPEQEYDDLTAIAAQICGTPVSLISLIDKDRQWFKSAVGLPPGQQQTSRDLAFCAHTILQPGQPMVVQDARADPRFTNNSLVSENPHVVFYAGVPLVTPEGHALGSLCVIDHTPRELTAVQLSALERLARQVVNLLELRRTLLESERRLQERDEAYAVLRDFSHVIAHDLKAPVRNIMQAAELLREECGPQLSGDTDELVQMIERRAFDASRMIDGVLRYSRVTYTLRDARETVNIQQTIEQAVRQLSLNPQCQVRYTGQVVDLRTSGIALLQIFQNLIGNALKFNDKATCIVTMNCTHPSGHPFTFTIHDNGPGIPPPHQQAVFKLFHSADPDETRSHGVGLAIVKRLVEHLGGTITLASSAETGTTFTFTLPE